MGLVCRFAHIESLQDILTMFRINLLSGFVVVPTKREGFSDGLGCHFVIESIYHVHLDLLFHNLQKYIYRNLTIWRDPLLALYMKSAIGNLLFMILFVYMACSVVNGALSPVISNSIAKSFVRNPIGTRHNHNKESNQEQQCSGDREDGQKASNNHLRTISTTLKIIQDIWRFLCSHRLQITGLVGNQRNQ